MGNGPAQLVPGGRAAKPLQAQSVTGWVARARL